MGAGIARFAFAKKRLTFTLYKYGPAAGLSEPRKVLAALMPAALPDTAAGVFSDQVSEGPSGWAGPRGAVDPLSDACIVGDFVAVNWTVFKRRVPATLFKALVARREDERMKMERKTFLARSVRAEIRKDVIDMLRPHSPLVPVSTAVLIDPTQGRVWIAATSDSACDAIRLQLFKAKVGDPLPVSIATLAGAAGVDVRDWPAEAMADGVPPGDLFADPAAEFMTLVFWSSRGPVLGVPSELPCMLVNGPMTFRASDGDETVIRGGRAFKAKEARAALAAGKLLVAANMFQTRGDGADQFRFDADRFAVRGLKLAMDESERAAPFLDRLNHLAAFTARLETTVLTYIEKRNARAEWRRHVAQIRLALRDWLAV